METPCRNTLGPPVKPRPFRPTARNPRATSLSPGSSVGYRRESTLPFGMEPPP